MNNKRVKRKKITKESTDSTSSQSIDEEDVLKIVKRYKLDINDHKNPYSAYVKLFLDNLNELLDDLIKKKEVESYDIFGGHRYGYLLINDINVDVLVKIYNVENVKNVFNYIKRNLSKLNTVNTKEKSKEQLNIWVLNNKNVSSNLLAKELVIEAKRGKKEFNFKLYFTIVKYDRKRSVRKVNINEYLMEKLDEVHRKYVNISNAVVLAKLFLQSYNLDKIALKEVASSLNGSGYGKVEACRTFGTSELNGHVFNLLLTHLCTINSYSENVKSIILFKNVLTFIVNTVGKDGGVLVYCEQNNSSNVGTTSGDNVADSKEEVSDRSYDRAETVFNDEINHKLAESGLYEEYVKSVSGEFRKRVSLYTQKYAEVDLLKHIELTFPQLVYYCKIGLGILSDDTSKADKIARLFLQRNYLSNFYEHNMFIRTDSSDGTDKLKQLLHLLRYVFKERLYLAHLYYIKRYSTDDTGSTSTSDNINTKMLDYGPKYTMNTSSGGRGNTAVSNFENKMYEYIWGDNYQLVKSNNIIQYTVNLSKITTRSADEQVLLLSDLDENLNYRLLKYVLYTLINKRLLRRIGVSINNFNVRYPFISEYQKDLISTTNDFTDILTSLECLPLKILNTQIINETYSYLNLYSPKVGENEGASDHGGVVKVVVKWEYSNKWPNEEVAYNNVVTSLLLLISKELKHRYRMDSKFREGCLYVEYGDHTYQLIHYKHNKGSGIGIGNTISMIGNSSMASIIGGSRSTANTATNDGGNSSFGSMISVIGSRNGGSMGVDDTVAKLEYEYVLNERCRSEVMKNISFVNCVKLMKIFTTKYVKVDINHTIKLLSLKAYEGKSIKSESSIVQFLQILDDNIGNILKGLSNDVVKKLREYSGKLLKEINGNLKSIPACAGVTVVDEERMNTILSDDWSYDMVVKLHNPEVNKSISTRCNYEGRKYMEYLLKYYKEYLGELADMYYYKYKVYGHFNTRTYRHLNVYFKFNKFSFVPRLSYKAHKYPQSIIMPITHCRRIRKVGDANSLIDTREYDWEDDGADNVIVVPNVILVLRVLTKLADQMLHNVVLTYNTR
ncbi:conserved hypothetical protein [Theileria orientalis strain Shintoku]|uniref:Nrap protein domain-containing protein n=1 Tax=Theileria orientalis strain Shintoku TaxID=869250 RepID=J4DNL0_THEOR|nr:conserved hypothetical protein [Theileria orientalis strain Shintoku]BAM39144.1 conserved hypothetical protein [Theileria orientalis strain Shintoku]|eukprot:XP_009689445.1 conserved hypothetical protein [Theileria orientalis strain Shintoku]